MDLSKRADRPPMPQDPAQQSVAPVLLVAQSVAVIEARPPTGHLAGPGADVVRHSHVPGQYVAAPAVMIARDPEDRNPGVREARQRGQHLEPRTRNDGAPLKPEVEEVAVDDDGSGGAAQMIQVSQERPFDLGRCDAQVYVGENEAWRRQHADSLSCHRAFTTPAASTIMRGPRAPGPTPTAPMPDPHSHDIEFRVRYGETDRMGVVYHAEYLAWCEMGRTEYIRSLGMSYAEMERRGVPLAVAEANIRYHAPAKYDDRIRVTTVLTRLGSRGLTFDYLITDADSGVRLASASTTLVALDAAGKATTIPPDIRALLDRADSR